MVVESEYFALVIDAKTYEVVSCSLTKPSIYARQAAYKIMELHKTNGALPKEVCSVWC